MNHHLLLARTRPVCRANPGETELDAQGLMAWKNGERDCRGPGFGHLILYIEWHVLREIRREYAGIRGETAAATIDSKESSP
jgi:hypothetical protein